MNLLQGTLDMLVLKALMFGPQHGYGVARWVRETTDGMLEVEEGALYTSLHRMARRGWLESEWGVSENNRRARFYRITRTGQKQLDAELAHWAQANEIVARFIALKGVKS